MFGQMTAGSWIYIGSQGIVQGTYETFVEMGRQHFDGDLSGRWILTAGLGGMGGAQPLAATMAGASMLASNVSPRASRCASRPATSTRARPISTRRWIETACLQAEKAISVGLLGNAAELLPEMVRRGVKPDAVTDQTSGPRPAQRLSAPGLDAARVGRPLRERDPDEGTIDGAPRPPWSSMSRRCSTSIASRRADLRLRQQHPPDGQGSGP